MKRKLLSQIYSERRSNAWLVVELILISSVLWWVTDALSMSVRLLTEPLGLDCKDVYQLQLTETESDSPLFRPLDIERLVEDGDTLSQQASEKPAIIDRIAESPIVKAVTTSSYNVPYTYNFRGEPVKFADTTFTPLLGMCKMNIVAPNYFEVFTPLSVTGETPGRLTEILAENDYVVSDNVFRHDTLQRQATEGLGRMMVDSRGGQHKMAALIKPVRRTDYEEAFYFSVYVGSEIYDPEFLYVRTLPGKDEEFRRFISDLNVRLRATGNVCISDVSSFKELRDNLHKNDDARVRGMVAIIAFFLIIVFLGLLGTFWFRTQERARELAVRKVTGATDADIFRRLIGEGLLLLVIATPVAVGIDVLLVHYDLFTSRDLIDDRIWLRMAENAAIVFVLMAVMVVTGILFPARKAMKVDPAEVLRSE